MYGDGGKTEDFTHKTGNFRILQVTLSNFETRKYIRLT